MSTTSEQHIEAQLELPSEPFFKKYALHIIVGLVVMVIGVGIYAINAVNHKPTGNPSIVKRTVLAARYLLNDSGQIGEGSVFKDKLTDGGYVYEVLVGADTLKTKEGKVQMDTVKDRDRNPVMDTVRDVLTQPIFDTLKVGTNYVIDTATKKPAVKVRLKYRLVPAVRGRFEFRNPENVEELPHINIHLLPPHP
jgi:hypothetical protein